MNNLCKPVFGTVVLSGCLFISISCSKADRFAERPELASFHQGIKTSAALAYCASATIAAHEGRQLPDNVTAGNNPGLLHITIDAGHPLPFSDGTGDILIASQWDETGGIMSVLFSGIDVLEGRIKLFGFWAVPLMEDPEDNNIRAFYADQDIILGNGSDTILDLSSITRAFFNSRLGLLETENPDDAFVAIKQNFWITEINYKGTSSNLYDDVIIINGGGQIAEVEGSSGGVLYHAMIGARLSYSVCRQSPIDGFALVQNFKAGEAPLIDFAGAYLSFHSRCDGKAHVEFSSGKYVWYAGRDIGLELY